MLAYWVHQLDPFVIRFPSNFPIEGIRWYGVAYFLGFWAAWLLLNIYTRKNLLMISPEQQQSLLCYLLLGILLGGRVGYVCLYNLDYYWKYPMEIFAFWKGGMSAHGGFIGVYLALRLFSQRQKLCLYSLADLVVCLVPIGIFLGRLANFINAEIIGCVTNVPWAVLFYNYALPRHPSQIYEALGEGLGLFLLTQLRLFKTHCVQRYPGQLTGEFLVYYGLIRIFLECFREPDAPLICNLSRGQFYSIFSTLLGLWLISYAHKGKVTNNVFKF